MRKTQKLTKALELLPKAKPENIYQELNSKGYQWDTVRKGWIFMGQAQEPTDLVFIRVWASLDKVDRVADEVVKKMSKKLRLQDRSRVYPCRPPKQSEGRVYLTFQPINNRRLRNE